MPRSSLPTALVGALVLVAACGDSTSPDTSGEDRKLLTVTLQGRSDISIYTDHDFAVAACAVTFQGASRSQAPVFAWRELRFTFYLDSSLTQPFDTAIVGGSDLNSSWNGGFDAGNQPLSEWTLSANVPFAFTAEFVYLDHGAQVRTDPIRVPCLLPVNAGAGPPAITNLHVTTDDGVITPPETIEIGYDVSAPAGSWQGVVRVWNTGCDTAFALANPTITAFSITRNIAIPLACANEDSLRVGAAFSDIRGRITEQDVAVPMFTPDISPPALSTNWPKVGGEYFTGDSLRFWVEGSENRELAYLIWEMAPTGYRDSVAVGGKGVYLNQRAIAMRPEWVGANLTFRYWLRDRVGLESNVIQSAPDTVHMYPTVTPVTVSRTIPGDLRAGVVDAKRNRVYLVEGNTATLTILSSTTLADIASLPTYSMVGIDFTPSGDSLVLAGWGRKMGIIDLTAPTLAIDTFTYATDGPLPGLDATVQVLNNGKAYVSTGGATPVVEVDLALRTSRVLPGSAVAFLGRSGDFSKAVATTGSQMMTFSAATGTFGSPRTEPWTIHTRMNGDGSRTAVGLKVFDGSLAPVRTIVGPFTYDLANTPRIALSNDGSTLFYPDYAPYLVRASTVTGRSIDRFPLPFGRPSYLFLALGADGRQLLYAQVNFGQPSKLAVFTLP